MSHQKNFSIRLTDEERVSLSVTAKVAGIAEADIVRICVKQHLPTVHKWFTAMATKPAEVKP